MNVMHSVRRKRANILKWIAFEWSSTLEIPQANHDKAMCLKFMRNLFDDYSQNCIFLNNNKLIWNFRISQIIEIVEPRVEQIQMKLWNCFKPEKKRILVYIQIHGVFYVTCFHLQLALITSQTPQITIKTEKKEH